MCYKQEDNVLCSRRGANFDFRFEVNAPSENRYRTATKKNVLSHNPDDYIYKSVSRFGNLALVDSVTFRSTASDIARK